jgi:transcriptional regulator with XRE-family HTH domain
MPNTKNGALAAQVQAEIRAEMARQQITQQALAHALGWRQDYVSRRLNGAARLSIGELEAIARALGRTVASLLPEGA